MITANVIICNKCNDIIQSVHVHDFNMCSCKSVGCDGEVSYLRRIGIDDGHLDALILYWEERLEKYENADTWMDIFKREKEFRNEIKRDILSKE